MRPRQTTLKPIDAEAPPASPAEIEPDLIRIFSGREFFLEPGIPGNPIRAFPKARRAGLPAAGEISSQDLPASGLLCPFAILSGYRKETGLIRTHLGIDEAEPRAGCTTRP